MSRERLAKLLGMLGSDFDGERANAAAMIAKMAKDAKKTVAELVMGGGGGHPQIVYRDRIIYRDRIVEKIVFRDRPGRNAYDADFKAGLKSSKSNKGIIDRLRAVLHDTNLDLTSFEIQFIDNVLERYESDDDLTEKQKRVARRIIDKVFGDPLI